MGILQSFSFSLASAGKGTFGGYLLLGLVATLTFLLLVFLISMARRGISRLQGKRVARYRIKTVDLTSDYQNRMGRSNARKGITAGIGMAVLVSMVMPVPATAYEFNLADRLLKNLETLNRMHTLGAAILIPDEFRQALNAHENALRHSMAIVTLWAFRKVSLERKASVKGNNQDFSIGEMGALNRWTLRKMIEHDSAGVEVSRKVQSIARRFALLRLVRRMLWGVGFDTPERSGPELPHIYRERVNASVVLLLRVNASLRFQRGGQGDSASHTIPPNAAYSQLREVAKWMDWAKQPERL